MAGLAIILNVVSVPEHLYYAGSCASCLGSKDGHRSLMELTGDRCACRALKNQGVKS